MQYKKNTRKIIQGADFHRPQKNIHKKWLTIDVNEEQHLPYWKLINKKEKLSLYLKMGEDNPPYIIIEVYISTTVIKRNKMFLQLTHKFMQKSSSNT